MKSSFLAGYPGPAAAGDNVVVTSPKPQFTQVVVTNEGTFNEPWALTFLPATSTALITEKQGKLKLWRKGRLRKIVPAQVGS